MRKPSGDAAGSDPGHGCSEKSEGTGREAREHVVFSEPAWPTRAFHNKPACFSVERLEVTMVAGRHFHSRRCSNVETGFVMQQDNVRKFARRIAGCSWRRLQVLRHSRICFQLSSAMSSCIASH